MENPLVSVIMATHNTKQEYLKQSIDSILNQTYANIEFIIVIDGCSDDEFIKNEYDDDRIVIIKNSQVKGLACSLNEAIRLSKGKYVARMDSDDISVLNRIEMQVNYMEEHSNIDITSTYYKEFGANKKTFKEKFRKWPEVRCKLFFVNVISHPSVMFRKSSIIDNNLYYDAEYIYSQDFELWNRNCNIKIEIIPFIGLNYRIHSNQVSSSKRDIQNKLYCKVLENNLLRLGYTNKYLDFMLVLNDRKKSSHQKEIYSFVVKLIERNEKIKIYDCNKFKKILKTQFEVYCLKNRQVFNLNFIKNLKYLIYKVF